MTYYAWREEMLRRERRDDRRFHIIMSIVCGVLVLGTVAIVWLGIATEPRRHAAYLTDCQAKGFTAEQCQFLYAEGRRRDSDEAAAIALGAAALAVSASRR